MRGPRSDLCPTRGRIVSTRYAGTYLRGASLNDNISVSGMLCAANDANLDHSSRHFHRRVKSRPYNRRFHWVPCSR